MEKDLTLIELWNRGGTPLYPTDKENVHHKILGVLGIPYEAIDLRHLNNRWDNALILYRK